jgi:hypothetical protein
MVVLSLGFSLVTAPSTAATMSSLRPDQLGAGAAVNNTTRELGGTLGVAILGSVFASRFSPAIGGLLRHGPFNAATRAIAESSMQGALKVIAHAPQSVQASLLRGVDSAFLTGMHRSCLVAAGIVAIVAVPTFIFMPSRAESAAINGADARVLAAVAGAQ